MTDVEELASKKKEEGHEGMALDIVESLMLGDLPEETEAKIREWIAAEKNPANVYLSLDRLYTHGFAEDSSPDKSVMESYERICKRIGFPQQTQAAPEKRIVPRRRVALRIAAVLIPAAAIIGIGMWTLRTGTPERSAVEVAALAGKSEMVAMPDGSQVCLHPGSRIVYDADFSGGREVSLSGEAFFRVAKQESPFRVLTDRMTIAVHGTEFHVQAHDNTGRSSVTLHSGSVEVAAGEGDAMVLEPGQQLKYYHDSGVTENFYTEPEDWSKPSMDFFNRTLDEIFAALELNYGVSILRPDALSTKSYTIRFSHSQDVDETIHLLSLLAHNFTWEREGDTIRITANKQ